MTNTFSFASGYINARERARKIHPTLATLRLSRGVVRLIFQRLCNNGSHTMTARSSLSRSVNFLGYLFPRFPFPLRGLTGEHRGYEFGAILPAQEDD